MLKSIVESIGQKDIVGESSEYVNEIEKFLLKTLENEGVDVSSEIERKVKEFIKKQCEPFMSNLIG